MDMEIDENNQLLINDDKDKNDKDDKEDKILDGEDSETNRIEINDKARRTIYICLVLINTFSACDGGIIPQQTSNIQKDFGNADDNALVGFFGSVDYIGRVIGALIFSFILGKMNRKMVLFSTLILKAITLFIALPFKGAVINIIFRGISGISQVFYTSYLPVWCDQYGKKKHRTMMVMIVQLGFPIGIILGYGIGMICESIMPDSFSGWRLGFGIEGVILIICAFIIIGFKKKYFSEKFVLIDDNYGIEGIKNEKNEEEKEEKEKNDEKDEKDEKKEKDEKDEKKEKKEKDEKQEKEEREEKEEKQEKEGKEEKEEKEEKDEKKEKEEKDEKKEKEKKFANDEKDKIEEIDEKEEEEVENEKNEIKSKNNIIRILCNKLFLFTTLANSVAFFGMAIVQYWGDKYMELVLEMETTLRFFIFSALCLLGPILGMVFGGIVCSKLGGYNKRRAMTFIIILTVVSAIISSVITLGNNTVIFILFSWCYLFFICASIPPESGIIISSLENNLRGDGFALSNSILNLIGSFPASYAFGSILDLFEKNLSKEDVENHKHYVYTMMTCMAYNFVGVIIIIIAGIFRFRIKGDLSGETEEELQQGENIGIDRFTVDSQSSREGSIRI